MSSPKDSKTDGVKGECEESDNPCCPSNTKCCTDAVQDCCSNPVECDSKEDAVCCKEASECCEESADECCKAPSDCKTSSSGDVVVEPVCHGIVTKPASPAPVSSPSLSVSTPVAPKPVAPLPSKALEVVCARVKRRLEQRSTTPRPFLYRLLARNDSRQGPILLSQLTTALRIIGCSVTPSQISGLMAHFTAADGGFDLLAFSRCLYPGASDPMSSPQLRVITHNARYGDQKSSSVPTPSKFLRKRVRSAVSMDQYENVKSFDAPRTRSFWTRHIPERVTPPSRQDNQPWDPLGHFRYERPTMDRPLFASRVSDYLSGVVGEGKRRVVVDAGLGNRASVMGGKIPKRPVKAAKKPKKSSAGRSMSSRIPKPASRQAQRAKKFHNFRQRWWSQPPMTSQIRKMRSRNVEDDWAREKRLWLKKPITTCCR